ncbi:MAG: ribonuclease H-like domain-containing protein [Candidatus Aenigmarchaeota archaeon]|nr:ribonuclease H-like domain-containing protein [Candidatus Aenigmarchaeota archaeon]
MEVIFQVLDCDYVFLNNKPVIRIFGKTKENKTVCAFYEGFLPYFYVLPKKNRENEFIEFMKKTFPSLLIEIKEVEKFLPIGFSKNKTKMLKVTITDPSKVPEIREELNKKDFVDKIFEADILFKYRFMADFNISGMGWVKVEGENTNTTLVKADKVVKIKKIESINERTNVSLKYLSLDIEVAPGKEGLPNPSKDQIIIISLSFFPAYENNNTLVLVSKPVKKFEKDVMVFSNETEMLQEFVEIVKNFDPDVIVGYNINNFDLPYILERLKVNKITRVLGRCNQKSINSRKVGIRHRHSIFGRVVVDVYELVKEAVEKGLLRLKRYGLGDVAKELLKEDKVDINHSEISKFWNGSEDQKHELINYARKDAELTLKILLEKDMLGKFIEISKVSGLLLQDVLDSKESARVENLLLKEFNKNDFVIPVKPSSTEVLKRMEEREVKGLKGALVLDPKVGLHTTCVAYLDFRSMYPSIFISFNICPSTLVVEESESKIIKTPSGALFVREEVREGIIPKILKFLIEERDKVKKEMEKTKNENERKILDAKQYALKIMANAFYGYTGYVRARLYVLEIANAITSCGRFLIEKTKNIVENKKGYEVVYGDTDSIMVKLQTTNLEEALRLGEELVDFINKEHEGIVKMKLEGIFKTLLVLTKKRYAGWNFEKSDNEWKEKILMKGIETVRRDWCDLVSKTLYNVIDIILKEQNPRKALKYVREVLTKLSKNEIPVEDLVITRGITKSIKEYKGVQPHIELVKKLRKRSPAEAPGIGDRIGYVIIQGSQLLSERAEDPEYVKTHNLKIDSKYYIESQLLPPLERVFDALGIKKVELTSFGKLISISEAFNHKKQEEVLNDFDGFICNKCNRTFRRIPLIGKCSLCGGEILFYFGEARARYVRL